MWSDSDAAYRINPYTRWVHEHPEHLLAEPTPEALRERLARFANGAGGRVHLELGCGSGNFMLQLAEAAPGDACVGFEIRFKRLVKAARKFEKAGLRNAWVLREWAERFPDYFPPGALDSIHINFPDPWPKPGQWKKRMVNPELMGQVRDALKPAGRFHLKTDHSGYFLHSLRVIGDLDWARIVFFSNDLRRHAPPGPRRESEFERMFRSHGKAVFYVCVEKWQG